MLEAPREESNTHQKVLKLNCIYKSPKNTESLVVILDCHSYVRGQHGVVFVSQVLASKTQASNEDVDRHGVPTVSLVTLEKKFD